MTGSDESYEVRPLLKIRRAYLDKFEASRRKNFIHGLVEIDVTETRRAVREGEAAGKDVSFTARDGKRPRKQPRSGPFGRL